MGACCCRKKRVSAAEDEGYGPKGRRSCHDLFFLLLFIAFWAGMVAVAYKAFQMGDLRRLKQGTDMYGNICGEDNTGANSPVLRAFQQDLRGMPYLYWPTPLDTGVQVCVAECPPSTPSASRLVKMLLPTALGGNATGMVCLYNVTEDVYEAVLDGSCWPPYKATALLGRCVPDLSSLAQLTSLFKSAYENISETKNATSPVNASAVANLDFQTAVKAMFTAINAREMLTQVMHDILESWRLILVLIAVSVVVSWLMLWVMRIFAGFIVWMMILLAIGILFAVTVVLWKFGYDLKTRLEKTPADQRLDADVNRQKALEISAYVFLGIDVILVFIVFALRKRIQLAIGIIKESSRALGSMPSTFFFPFFTCLLHAAFLAYWVLVFCYLSTAATVPNNVQAAKSTVYGYKVDHLVRYLGIYHLFGLFWTTQFIAAIHDTTIAGAVASWYWVIDKKKEVPRFVAWRFLLTRVLRYHLGSLALGSLIVAIIQMIRAMLRYAEYHLRGHAEYRIVKWVLRGLQCCFWCIEKIVKFINRHAYIMIAIKGDGFCRSAARAFTLLLSNVLRVGVVNSISTFLLFIFRIMIVSVTCLIAALVLQDQGLHFWIVPVLVIGVGSWVVASVFASIYHMAIDTILLSFCEDSDRNNGTPDRPYFMSAALRAFVDGHMKKKTDVDAQMTGVSKSKSSAGGKDAKEKHQSLGDDSDDDMPQRGGRRAADSSDDEGPAQRGGKKKGQQQPPAPRGKQQQQQQQQPKGSKAADSDDDSAPKKKAQQQQQRKKGKRGDDSEEEEQPQRKGRQSDSEEEEAPKKKQQQQQQQKKAAPPKKSRQADSDAEEDEEEEEAPQARKKAPAAAAQKKGGKKAAAQSDDEDDSSAEEEAPRKTAGKKAAAAPKGKKHQEPEEEEEASEEESPRVAQKKGTAGKKAQQKKLADAFSALDIGDEDEKEDEKPRRGAKGKQQPPRHAEDSEEEAKAAAPKAKAKGRGKQAASDDEDEAEESRPAPKAKQAKKPAKKAESESEEEEEEETPRSKKAAGKKAKHADDDEEEEEQADSDAEEDDEEEAPQARKKAPAAAAQKKGGKKAAAQSDDEDDSSAEEEAPRKAAGKKAAAAPKGKKHQEPEEEEASEEEESPRAAQKKGAAGKKAQQKKLADAFSALDIGDEDEKEDEKPRRGAKGKQQPPRHAEDSEEEAKAAAPKAKAKGRGKQAASDDEDEAEESRPAPKAKQAKKPAKKAESESEEEEEEETPRSKKAAGKKAKHADDDEEEEESAKPKAKQAKKPAKKPADDEEEEEEAEEDEAPKHKAKPAKKTSKKPAADEDEDEEEEEAEEPKAVKAKHSAAKKPREEEPEEEAEAEEQKMEVDEGEGDEEEQAEAKTGTAAAKKGGPKKLSVQQKKQLQKQRKLEEQRKAIREREAAEALAASAEAMAAAKKKEERKPRAAVMTTDVPGGVIASQPSGEGGSATAAAQATANVSIIVSAGGTNTGGRKFKWPDYVFLKGTGFSHKGRDNARDVKIEDFSLAVPGKVLIKNATLTLAYGKKYGLLGRNGIGKSVLLRALSSREPGTPFASIPANIRILHVQQEVTGDDRSPLATVMAADIERTWLLAEVERLLAKEKERRAKSPTASDAKPAASKPAKGHIEGDSDSESDEGEDDEDGEGYTIADLYERLRDIEAHKAIPRAVQILLGLGFEEEDIRTKPTKAYSGGWRMRIALAQALFLQPELLILDEPTNHLDLQAVIWLEAYLAHWRKSLLLVTHDASFVSNACDNIIHFHNQTISQYRGDYFSFLRAREQQVTHLTRQLDKQSKMDKKMRDFKETHKSGNDARLAKSKLKQMAKVERVEAEKEEAIPMIDFPEPGQLGLPVLQFQEASFGYDATKPPMFRNLEFGIYLDSRIGLVGPNGAGKTTLVKLMCGDLKETEGYVNRNPHLVMARFAQHHVDQLNMDMTPIEYIQSKFNAQTQDIRQFIGRFGITGGMALQKIATLSGGQRSRLVFAELCYRRPHILLLDEPTNHLDMDTIEVLIEAIREFKGGVVIISHHQRLIEAACDQVWVVKDNEVTRFEGEFEDYKKDILRTMPSVDSDDDD
eukprot:m51a1_g13402 putative gcn20-type atp-binding cassette protein (2078) ;mRNA; f:15730-23292